MELCQVFFNFTQVVILENLSILYLSGSEYRHIGSTATCQDVTSITSGFGQVLGTGSTRETQNANALPPKNEVITTVKYSNFPAQFI